VKTYLEYFADDNILHYICKYRAKLAKRRNRTQLVYNVNGNKEYLHAVKPSEEDILLFSLFPSRAKWKKLSQRRRTRDNHPINTLDKTVLILKLTVNWCRKNEPDAPFLKIQEDFFNQVRNYASNKDAHIPPPQIIPIVKDEKKKTCRPIAKYPISARIAISLTNKYLTECFDEYFEECSFAFRSQHSKNESKGKRNHHEAFEVLVAKRNKTKGDLWVTECDIQKFYDTVNHSILKQKLKRFVAKVKKNPELGEISKNAIRVFHEYLRSYVFKRNVLSLNKCKIYFSNHLEGYKFEWVERDLVSEGIYKKPGRARIGVPQGGALSGLIANIYLDGVDKAILKNKDNKLIYVRYCDDMIILHDRMKYSKEYKEIYERELRKIKLLPHKAIRIKEYSKEFWEVKSKEPYKWGPSGKIPWIGFVGYEIHFNGNIRVRRKSLKKEMKKQYEIVQEVIGTIRTTPRVSHRTIKESVINRLIQMSVGRIRLHNYTNVCNEMCWINGFKCLNDNKYSRIQMKRLDACRNKLIRKLDKRLAKTENPILPRNQNKKRAIIYYGKPFSYYFQAIEKKRHIKQKVQSANKNKKETHVRE